MLDNRIKFVKEIEKYEFELLTEENKLDGEIQDGQKQGKDVSAIQKKYDEIYKDRGLLLLVLQGLRDDPKLFITRESTRPISESDPFSSTQKDIKKSFDALQKEPKDTLKKILKEYKKVLQKLQKEKASLIKEESKSE